MSHKPDMVEIGKFSKSKLKKIKMEEKNYLPSNNRRSKQENSNRACTANIHYTPGALCILLLLAVYKIQRVWVKLMTAAPFHIKESKTMDNKGHILLSSACLAGRKGKLGCY